MGWWENEMCLVIGTSNFVLWMVGSDVDLLGNMFTWRSRRDFLHLDLRVRSCSSTIQSLREGNFQCQVTRFRLYAVFSVILLNSNSMQFSVSCYEIQLVCSFQCQVTKFKFYAIYRVKLWKSKFSVSSYEILILCNDQCQVTKFKFYANFCVKLWN